MQMKIKFQASITRTSHTTGARVKEVLFVAVNEDGSEYKDTEGRSVRVSMAAGAFNVAAERSLSYLPVMVKGGTEVTEVPLEALPLQVFRKYASDTDKLYFVPAPGLGTITMLAEVEPCTNKDGVPSSSVAPDGKRYAYYRFMHLLKPYGEMTYRGCRSVEAPTVATKATEAIAVPTENEA